MNADTTKSLSFLTKHFASNFSPLYFDVRKKKFFSSAAYEGTWPVTAKNVSWVFFGILCHFESGMCLLFWENQIILTLYTFFYAGHVPTAYKNCKKQPFTAWDGQCQAENYKTECYRVLFEKYHMTRSGVAGTNFFLKLRLCVVPY